MTTFTLVEIHHNRRDRYSFISTVIAVYTNEETASKEADRRRQNCIPSGYRHAYGIQNMRYINPRDIEYRVLVTELITDKFTEFALKGTQQ